MAEDHFDFVVIGGGVAGTCCANQLCYSKPNASICLVSPSDYLKSVKVVKKVTENLDELTVIEQPFGSFKAKNLRFVQDFVSSLEPEEKRVVLSSGKVLSYGKLAICSGASPKTFSCNSPSGRVLTVRDTDSADELNRALSKSKKVVVAGNGAIALEVITKLRGLDISWIVKQGHIGDALLDVDVGLFLLECYEKKNKGSVHITQSKATRKGDDPDLEEAPLEAPPAKPQFSHGLGPKWTIRLSQNKEDDDQSSGNDNGGGGGGGDTNLNVVYNIKLVDTVEPSKDDSASEWPVYAVLSNGERIGADLVISCVGVLPNTTWIPKDKGFEFSSDGGLLVDEKMQTSVSDVYAAGDICTLRDDINCGPQFFQIRLWSQARLMGEFAAHCMADSQEADLLDLGFELVSLWHTIKVFSYFKKKRPSN